MKKNELMIGDWVKSLKEDHSGEYGQVIDIDHHDTVLLEYQCVNYYTDVEHIEPIPLTPEILEKNGFTRYGQVYANLQQWVGKFGDKRKSFVQDIRTGEWGMNDVWINYVHELQHVLKLCKIEKEIEL